MRAAPFKEVPELNNNNRGNNNRRRGRSNNGRPQNGGGQQLNRIDSRARGNAPQMLEKYRKLAQDAHLNGDRVQAEYYLQFADHYFRVIADSRVRLEDQRTRAPGPNGERWQESEGEDDAGDFSVEGDFAAFDRAPSRQEREARDERPREDRPRDDRPRDDRSREDRPRDDRPREDRPRNDRPRDDRQRDDHPRDDRPRNDRPRDDRPRDDQPRDDQPREDRPRRFKRDRETENAVVAEAPLPGEPVAAIEGELIADASDNPFVRENRGTRGLRPRNEKRQRPAASDDAPATFDPSSLPPSISLRAEPEPKAAPAPAAPAPTPDPVVAADDAVPAPKKRGRPRKNPLPEATAPVEG